jgi:Carboxypeptidase regulatory-like domain/DNA circularisation protein N-terminus
MSIEIDSFPLIKRIQDSQSNKLQELRNVYNISINARRAIVEHRIAGSDTTILQDMGRNPIRVRFEGDLIGEKSKDSLQDLWIKFRQGKPVPFSSDITGITDLTNVLIEELAIQSVGGNPDRYHYFMSLSEYKPPKQATEQDAPDQSEAAQKSVDDQSQIDDIRGKVLDLDGNPAQGVNVKLTGPDGDRQGKTDSQGQYEFLDLPDGDYEVTVDAQGYEGLIRKVQINKGGGTSGSGGSEGQSGQSQESGEGTQDSDQGQTQDGGESGDQQES